MANVQEICKKFEELVTQNGSEKELIQSYNKNVKYGKQYKSMTALNNEEMTNEINSIINKSNSIKNEPIYVNIEELKAEINNLNNSNTIYRSESSLHKLSDNSPVVIRKSNRIFKPKAILEENDNKITENNINHNLNSTTIYENRLYDGNQEQPNTSDQFDEEFPDIRKSHLKPIVDELVKTEENYVVTLRTGYENYKTIFDSNQILPKGLVGKKYVLFRTIEDILEFHENEMLPMLQANQYDLKTLCLYFRRFIEDNKFYPHLLYIMHKRRTENLCKYFKSFFDEKAKQFNDKLGITSLLIQPLHRITKYPLLFQQIIKDCFNKCIHDNKIKSILELCCKTEKKMSDYVKLINESERVGNICEIQENINLYEEGRLKKVDKFYVFDRTLGRRFKSRVFLFEKSLIYTEIVTKLHSEKLKYRGIFPCDNISIEEREPGFTLFSEKRSTHYCDLEAKRQDVMKTWITTIKNITSDCSQKKLLQSRNSDCTPYNNLFRYRFLNRITSTYSRDTIGSSSTYSLNSNRMSIVSTGSFHTYNTD